MGNALTLGGYRIPGWLLIVYAILFTLLGWSASGIWAAYRYPPPSAVSAESSATLPAPALAPAALSPHVCIDGELAPLRYSAHVYADEPRRRSVTFNGQRYLEGDRLPCGEVVAQIQPSLVILERGERVIILDALEDWIGSAPNRENVNERE
ncbi:General secretion pathway protein B [Mixta theicola]|nr:general secretion pathway protein GspB [Mixta theicola]QHM76293.1 General secretion pathway protein B [Mixta theicola]